MGSSEVTAWVVLWWLGDYAVVGEQGMYVQAYAADLFPTIGGDLGEPELYVERQHDWRVSLLDDQVTQQLELSLSLQVRSNQTQPLNNAWNILERHLAAQWATEMEM